MFPCPTVPAPFTKLHDCIDLFRSLRACPCDLDTEHSGHGEIDEETRCHVEQQETALNDEFLQCAAFLQAKPHLGIPLHVFEFASAYRSVEAEAFISAAEGHEIIETESTPRARARI